MQEPCRLETRCRRIRNLQKPECCPEPMAGTSQTCIVPGTSGRITGDTIPGVMEVQGQVLSLDFPARDGLGRSALAGSSWE